MIAGMGALLLLNNFFKIALIFLLLRIVFYYFFFLVLPSGVSNGSSISSLFICGTSFQSFVISWKALIPSYCNSSGLKLFPHLYFSQWWQFKLSSVVSYCSFQFALHLTDLQISPWNPYSLKCPASPQSQCLLAEIGYSMRSMFSFRVQMPTWTKE